MGVNQSNFEVLEELSIKNTNEELYWPEQPHEGPVKIRFACSKCKFRGIFLEAAPVQWKDLKYLRGFCSNCNKKKPVRHTSITLFCAMESHKGDDNFDVIFEYNPKDSQMKKKFPIFLQKLLSSSPFYNNPSLAKINFSSKIVPENYQTINTNRLPEDFSFPTRESTKDLSSDEKIELIEDIINSHFIEYSDSISLTFDNFNEEIVFQKTKTLFLSASPELLQKRIIINVINTVNSTPNEVKKKYYDIIFNEIAKRPLFDECGTNQTLYPSPNSKETEDHLGMYKFIGRFLGKCFFDSVEINLNLNICIYKLLLGISLHLEDLQYIDTKLFRELSQTALLSEEELLLKDIDFSIYHSAFNKTRKYSIVEESDDIINEDTKVSTSNIHEYLKKAAIWRISYSVYDELEQLLHGFYDIIPIQLLQSLTVNDFIIKLAPNNYFEASDMKEHTVFQGSSDLYEKWFWEVIEDLTPYQRSFLLYTILGTINICYFDLITPPFTVHFYATKIKNKRKTPKSSSRLLAFIGLEGYVCPVSDKDIGNNNNNNNNNDNDIYIKDDIIKEVEQNVTIGTSKKYLKQTSSFIQPAMNCLFLEEPSSKEHIFDQIMELISENDL